MPQEHTLWKRSMLHPRGAAPCVAMDRPTVVGSMLACVLVCLWRSGMTGDALLHVLLANLHARPLREPFCVAICSATVWAWCIRQRGGGR